MRVAYFLKFLKYHYLSKVDPAVRNILKSINIFLKVFTFQINEFYFKKLKF